MKTELLELQKTVQDLKSKYFALEPEIKFLEQNIKILINKN